MIKARDVEGRDEGALWDTLGAVCSMVLMGTAWVAVTVSSVALNASVTERWFGRERGD